MAMMAIILLRTLEAQQTQMPLAHPLTVIKTLVPNAIQPTALTQALEVFH